MDDFLEKTTPLILTYNEEDNIGRTLSKLNWAKEVVVVDSFSEDATLDIIAGFKNVRVVQRTFDNHAAQWNYGLHETGISTEWVLALDADYLLSEQLIEELNLLKVSPDVMGYEVSFIYCVFSRPLRGAIYPPVTVLYRKEEARYIQDGHTQRIMIDGKIEILKNKILHDDYKPLSIWLQAQNRYMDLEVRILQETPWGKLRLSDKVRKMVFVAPFVAFFYCLFVKKGILDGKYGLFYAFQRSLAEMLLALKLIEMNLRRLEIGK